MLEIFIPAFVAMFVTMDPIGNVPIFISLTRELSRGEKLKTAFRAIVIAGGLLVLFGFFGNWLLGNLGITMSAFKIAGGILLFIIALEMLFSKRTERKANSAEEAQQQKSGDDLAVFPLAIPLIAGPGSITTAMIWIGSASDPTGQIIALVAVAAVLVAFAILFSLSVFSERFISATVANVITRLLGMLLAALATQSIIDGIQKVILS
jgi:multiple antibiotic resistance protein